MLIPTWFLLLEVIVLEILIIRTYFVHRFASNGIIALSLFLPVLYFVYLYISIDHMDFETGRIMIRYGQAILFFMLNVIAYKFSGKGE